jgi:hypothetical protein
MAPDVVEAIFTKFALVYGSAKFNAMYRDQDVRVLKAHWVHELRGLNDQDVAYALAHLPPHEIPNVLQLRMIALRRPPAAFPQLAEPPASPERVERVLARMRALGDELTKQHSSTAWAWKLRAREANKEQLLSWTRHCWREALATELATELRQEGEA